MPISYLMRPKSSQQAGSLSLTSPVAYQTYQRDTATGQATITVSGAYSGAPAAIEARWNGGTWATIDAAPGGGSFSGSLTNQPAGQGALEVRFTDDTSVTAESTFIGVGDVYLVAGQSNAEGRLTNAQAYSHATLKAAMFREDGLWRELADPTDSEVAEGSVWPLVATSIMADQGVPVAFITTADGSTGLVSPDAHWSKGGAQYNNCVSIIQASEVNALRSILWYQGERDAGNGIARATYAAALSQMLDDLQVDLGIGAATLIAAQLSYASSLAVANLNAIRLAISDTWDSDADIFPGPVLCDVNLLDSGGDGAHFKTDAEAVTLANRWWRSLLAQVYGSATYKGPARFASAAQVDSTHIDVTFTVPASPLTMTAGDVTGWAVTDGNGSRTVTDAQLQSSTVVRLTVDQALSGAVTVSYASGNAGVGSSLKDTDASGISMPPAPFINQTVV